MGLVIPSIENYQEGARMACDFFQEHELEYSVYGSFLVQEKVRLGLSDIDIFVIDTHTTANLFPIALSRTFGVIKRKIEELGIPLQVNLTTKGQLSSPLLCPDNAYLGEVNRGSSGVFASLNFQNALLQANIRHGSLDDEHMIRHFHKKVVDLGVDLEGVDSILGKNLSMITPEEQRKIAKLWMSLKKVISYMALKLRIEHGESLFQERDSTIIEHFCHISSIDRAEFSEFEKMIANIRDIKDWIIFLQNSGIDTIIDFYQNIFQKIFATHGLSSHLGAPTPHSR